MSRSGRRLPLGLKLAASMCAGIGLMMLAGGTPANAASAKDRRDGRPETPAPGRAAGTPVMAVVSLNQQRVTIYDKDGPILQAPVSTGQTGYETPAGIFTVLEKEAEHYSNLYDDASMPFMQRLTWSGIALHAGALPGYPASHGCIRMPLGFAENLFGRTKLGLRVVVMRDDVSPVDFAHPILFKPLPGDVAAVDAGAATVTGVSTGTDAQAPRPRMSVRAVAAAKVAAAAAAARSAEEARLSARSATIESARATKMLRRAEAVLARAEAQLRQAEPRSGLEGAALERAQHAKDSAQAAVAAERAQLAQVQAEMQPKIDQAARLREQAKEAATAQVAAQEEAREAQRKLSPVSVFISRATQRLYVRQAREPLFDMPVTIADPGRPLGTYIFTALASANEETDLRWSVVSMYRHAGAQASNADRRRDRHAPVAAADHSGAKAALDRIAIPKEAADRIAEVVAPGASLIVSDESLSRETGKATEFIVVMSGEPQGGIKIRRRNPSPPAEVRYRSPRPAYGGAPYGWSAPSMFWWQ